MRQYPVEGKKKSADLCRAFSIGAQGDSLDAAVFYGVDESNLADFYRARKSGSDWYYIDNAYFDCVRGTHFRVTKNAIQHSGRGATNGARWRALNVKLKPWRENGKHILVVPQSDDFMRRIVGYSGNWTEKTVEELKKYTQRPIRVREWNRDKIKAAASLGEDLADAWAVVTHSSAAAIAALIEGIPIISEAGAAARMSITYEKIEWPSKPEGRENFLGVLADNQWTVAELSRGDAWTALKAQ